MYAIVATGGKQVKVATGDVVSVEKLDAAVGDAVKFDVIFIADDGEITVDADALAAATVTGEVVEHYKGEKAVIFKFKKRKGYKRLKGHRQDLTKVRITEVASGEAPKKKAAKPKTEKVDKADKAEKAEKVEKAEKAEAAVEVTPEAAPEKPKRATKPKAEKAPKAEAPEVVEEKAPEQAEEVAPEQVEEPVAEATETAETEES